MKTFLYDYYHMGSRWELKISAKSKDDADAIIKSLPLARYAGELKFSLPTAITPKWFINMIYWILTIKQNINRSKQRKEANQ